MPTVWTHELFESLRTASDRSPRTSSALAWEWRNTALPTRFHELTAYAAAHAVSDEVLLRATWVCARRLHFLFAYGSLSAFTHAALERFPDDEMLAVCNAAAAVMQDDDVATWEYLRNCADLDLCDGIAAHALLTALVQHPYPPAELLAHGLTVAARRAPTDTVALYRKAAILRRLELFTAALAALDAAAENLARGFEIPATTEHLVERMFAERQLILSLSTTAVG